MYSVSMPKKVIIGVMGAGETASEQDMQLAFLLGQSIAKEGWVLLSGGRSVGVMDAVNKGAKSANGLTIGIMPRQETDVSDAVDIPVITDMGSARNNVNVLSSDVVVACGIGGAGSISEIALAVKSKKTVILLHTGEDCERLFLKIGKDFIKIAEDPTQAILLIKQII